MHLMYVDESGDPGLTGSPTRYFVLSGLVIHESDWHACLARMITFRQSMKLAFGLKLREEIHAAHFISSPGSLQRIKRNDRLTIIRHLADEVAKLPSASIINVIVDKQGKPNGYDAFEKAWEALIQRFENTIHHRNFPNSFSAQTQARVNECGMIFPDGTDSVALTGLVRRMRRYNPIPSQHGPGYLARPIQHIIEDPNYRDSRHSYFVQACDVSAFLLYQHLAPNAYMKRKGAHNYYKRISPIYCRAASPRDPLGIVRL